MIDEYRVIFEILGSESHPDEITKISGIEPGETVVGQAQIPGSADVRADVWRISGEFEQEAFDRGWTFVHDRLRSGDLEALKKSVGGGSARFRVTYKTDLRGPAFELPRDLMEIAAFLGAVVQVES